MPHQVVFGNKRIRGIDITPLYILQGALHVENILYHLRKKPNSATLLKISLLNLQLESDSKKPVISDPLTESSHLTPSWVKQLWQFLFTGPCSLKKGHKKFAHWVGPHIAHRKIKISLY